MVKLLRVEINAQIFSGAESGGVEQFIISLVRAWGRLYNDLTERVIIRISHGQDQNRLSPYLGANQKMIPVLKSNTMDTTNRMIGPLRRAAGILWRRMSRIVLVPTKSPYIPGSDCFYKFLGVNLFHFPIQKFIRCNLPTIFNPYDLQHLNYLQFFTQEQIVSFGEGAIVGAGSVVTKDASPWTIAAGNSAIKLREIPEEEL